MRSKKEATEMGLKAVVYGTKDGWVPSVADESGRVVASSYPALPNEKGAQVVALAMLARLTGTDRLAPLDSMVLDLADMIEELREWLPYNSRLAIAAAGLSSGLRDLEQAIREMQEKEVTV